MSQKRITPEERYELMSVYEKKYAAQGILNIAGIDEAGRGPFAGPVVASCVILDPDRPIYGVNDSKKLSEKRRGELFPIIQAQALSYGIGIVDEKVIDEINILEATKRAMLDAVRQMRIPPGLLLIDALKLPTEIPQEAIIHGDCVSVSIACASILAKETRDQIMRRYDQIYPQYGFARHKGYGTKEHQDAILKYGPCPIHRRTFLKKLYARQQTDRDTL